MQISARNHVPKMVKTIKKGPVNTEVVVTLNGGSEIVSVITTCSAEHPGLEEGSEVYAIMKASEPIIGID